MAGNGAVAQTAMLQMIVACPTMSARHHRNTLLPERPVW